MFSLDVPESEGGNESKSKDANNFAQVSHTCFHLPLSAIVDAQTFEISKI